MAVVPNSQPTESTRTGPSGDAGGRAGWPGLLRDKTASGRALLVLFLAVHLLLSFNALFHDPTVGYDASEHILYIPALARMRIPTPEDTFEYFSAPLAYAPPALFHATGLFSILATAKIAQVINVAYSVGLTFYLLKLCDLLRPGSTAFKIAALGLLGSFPVYYKTFAFVRGEPLLAFLAVLAVYQAALLFLRDDLRPARVAAFGLSLGLLLLARQWGLFLLPVFGFCAGVQIVRYPARWAATFRAFFVSLGLALLVAGWFYFHLYREYGTLKPFPRDPAPRFSLSNQPPDFYLSLGLDRLFADPIRKAFPNQFIPKFYSEFWGDYECYFVVYGWDPGKGQYEQGLWLEEKLQQKPLSPDFQTNRYRIGAYLGRVNLVSLLPTAVLAAGFLSGMIYLVRLVDSRLRSVPAALFSSIQLVLLVSFAGYAWFLIMYPNPSKGDTIKASYLLQVFPFVALLAADVIETLRLKSPRVFLGLAVLLAASTLHNAPLFISRYLIAPPF